MYYGLPQHTIHQLQSTLKQYPQVRQAILYGSRAKGTHHPGSDIDLTLRGDDLALNTLLRLANDIDDLLLPYTVDLSLWTHLDTAVREEINQHGRLFYQKQALPTPPSPTKETP